MLSLVLIKPTFLRQHFLFVFSARSSDFGGVKDSLALLCRTQTRQARRNIGNVINIIRIKNGRRLDKRHQQNASFFHLTYSLFWAPAELLF